MVSFIYTRCAICETFENSTVLYNERLPADGIDSSPYAPRRERDYYHYRLVKCNKCGLVRSDPIIASEELSELYSDSKCSYTDKNENIPLKKTYGTYLEGMIKKYNIKKNSFLDIGCSNGFMLEKARELGFKVTVGVEPSSDAIEKASPATKPNIIEGMFNENMFKPEQFDVITFFQTFDHVTEPNKFLIDCFRVLRKGGFILAINHNARSFSAKVLGERSPIIDIGHAYLYDLNTMKQIFQKNQFIVHDAFSVKNVSSLGRLINLLPINHRLKHTFDKILSSTGMDGISIQMNIGNLGIIAQKS